MKTLYKGFEITVNREPCMAGYDLIYYWVVRLSDGYVVIDDFTDSADTLFTITNAMKSRVDGYPADPAKEEWDDDNDPD